MFVIERHRVRNNENGPLRVAGGPLIKIRGIVDDSMKT
jgi:hypothetical protein